MIKIIHFINDTNIGGAGKLLCNQIGNMSDDDLKISVVVPRGSKLAEVLSPLPCEVIERKFGADKSFTMRALIEDLKILKRERPSIVHSHACLSSRIAATMLKIPVRVHTRHSVFPLPKIMKNPISRAIVGGVNNMLSTAMIAVSDSAKAQLEEMGCDGGKITTIINGSEPICRIPTDEREDLKRKYSISEGDFVISIFARLEKYKGHKTFLEAARVCLSHHPNFRYFVVGDGSQMENLKMYSKELQIENRVLFTGFTTDVASIFNLTDVNVNCSYGTETSSLALSEGMSIAIPCVASDYEGNTYMVKNEENGLIFPMNDAYSLANCLMRLYEDKNLYAKCSRGAYKRFVSELNAKSMAEKMVEFYKREYRKNNPKDL